MLLNHIKGRHGDVLETLLLHPMDAIHAKKCFHLPAQRAYQLAQAFLAGFRRHDLMSRINNHFEDMI